jgi:leucyl/phenylalanyl-tRNA--protein transferase
MFDIQIQVADEMGLVGVGGDLEPERLLAAYREGVFPWYEAGTPILWWCPDPRGIIPLDGFHVSRRLARTIRSGRFRVTHDQAFASVMDGCAERDEGTWITDEMKDAYQTLHRMGHAHSVEVWAEATLVGGLYGVAAGRLFAGESMFSRRSDASKVALAWLVDHLRKRGFQLFDVQMVTDHTTRLGAIEITREEYLRQLRVALVGEAEFETR